MMEIDILDSLEDFGYEDDILDEEKLKKAIDAGTESVEFTKLTSWLSKRLKVLCNMEDFINFITDTKETDSFLLELSSFLKELGCPYTCLTEGPLNERLNTRENRVLLLDFLCSELHAACLIHGHEVSKRKKSKTNTPAECFETLINYFKVDVDDTESPLELYIKLNSQVEKVISRHPELISPPLLTEELSDAQWEALEQIQKDMHEEYKVRRQMLLTRLDVTIHSFKWGESSQGRDDKIAKIYQPKVGVLGKSPDVNLHDILIAREDIAVLNKTSCSEVRKNTKSLVNTVIIGEVPDRGGRPGEQRIMPVAEAGWSKKPEFRRGGMNRGGGFPERGHPGIEYGKQFFKKKKKKRK